MPHSVMGRLLLSVKDQWVLSERLAQVPAKPTGTIHGVDLSDYKRAYRELLEQMSKAVHNMTEAEWQAYQRGSQYATDEVKRINHQCESIIVAMVAEVIATKEQ